MAHQHIATLTITQSHLSLGKKKEKGDGKKSKVQRRQNHNQLAGSQKKDPPKKADAWQLTPESKAANGFALTSLSRNGNSKTGGAAPGRGKVGVEER